ncbi:MAG: virulence protein RhuM/Fic/DOC family protein [Bacteroidia bacterium]|nr:virulence protein RhuM/Fic/DOC family protein [Bacteroidia bacterium]
MNQIEIYKGENNETQIEVKFEGDTVWLNQSQLSELLETDRTSILKHIKNIYKTKELTEKQTCAKIAQVRKEGQKEVKREVLHYNLDVIISVGYRVNSKRGTQFRQWATKRLKDYLVEGYAINQERLNQLQKTIQLIESTGKTDELSLNEAKGLLNIITNYTNSFVLLNRFDSNNLETGKLNEEITYEIKYPEAVNAVKELKRVLLTKKEATELFGKEKDNSFEGLLGNVVQSFSGHYLYRSIEEQAAHLLYFSIKNHPFTDGNKRIGAFLFIWFLQKNKHRFKKSGEVKINDNGLTALALLVAQSNPNDKTLMIKLIVNLINGQ